MQRQKLDTGKQPRERLSTVGNYFTMPASAIRFISTGCALLDCALGGGLPLGRIVNIVGDKSTGKTLLAVEAAANFYQAGYDGHVCYCETEAAFDTAYAEALGIDFKRVIRPKDRIRTVQDFFNHLHLFVKNRGPLSGLYILDSLDALADDAEMLRDFDDKSTFGAEKAKKLSEAFRRLTQSIEESRVCLIIISQIRENIGVMFGRKYKRSGGKALDFYASQVIYLAQTGVIKKTREKVERIVGVEVRAKVDKNKIGLPFREADFPIRFGFGIDDVMANIDWLISVDRVDRSPALKGRNVKILKENIDRMSDKEYGELRDDLQRTVKTIWAEVENRFLPTRRKYLD